METTQTVNLEELEEKYGTELVRRLKINIDWANGDNLPYEITKLEEDKWSTTFAFACRSFVRTFEVSQNTKDVDVNMLGYTTCIKALELMKKF